MLYQVWKVTPSGSSTITPPESRPNAEAAAVTLNAAPVIHDCGNAAVCFCGTEVHYVALPLGGCPSDGPYAAPGRPLFHLNRHDLAVLATSGDVTALAEWQARERGSLDA